MSLSVARLRSFLLGLICIGVVGACGRKKSRAPEPVTPPPSLVQPTARSSTPVNTAAAPVPSKTVSLAPTTVILDADALQKSPTATVVHFGLSSGTTSAGAVTYECKLGTDSGFSACNGGDSYTFANLSNGTTYTLAVRGTITATKALLTEASVTFTAQGLTASGDAATSSDATQADSLSTNNSSGTGADNSTAGNAANDAGSGGDNNSGGDNSSGGNNNSGGNNSSDGSNNSGGNNGPGGNNGSGGNNGDNGFGGFIGGSGRGPGRGGCHR